MAGIETKFKFDLTDGLKHEFRDITGGFLKVIDTSSVSVEAEIAVVIDGVKTDYYDFEDEALFNTRPFDRFYISAPAQAGETITIMVTNSEDDFNYEKPTRQTISGIAEAVKVKNDPDNDFETKVSNVDELHDLTGFTYASTTNAKITLVEAVDNTAGVVVKKCTWSTAGTSFIANRSNGLRVDGDPVTPHVVSSSNFVGVVDFFKIPAGVKVELDAVSAVYHTSCFYKVL